MKARTEVLDILRSLKDELRERYHVESMAFFGPYAREEQGEGSDIDGLVGFGSGVDVVPSPALRPDIRRQVTRDLLFA